MMFKITICYLKLHNEQEVIHVYLPEELKGLNHEDTLTITDKVIKVASNGQEGVEI